jgi:TRAP-type C4-dicarboxylate transport system permease small subunit
MRVSFVRDHLPAPLRIAADVLAELLMAMVGVYMMIWGYRLCGTTWNQSIAEFPALSVGVTYLPIPLGGFCLLLFVIEHLVIGTPPDKAAVAAFD